MKHTHVPASDTSFNFSFQQRSSEIEISPDLKTWQEGESYREITPKTQSTAICREKY